MKRIEYIDAMRGMAMFMVIVYHISFGCFHSENIITKIVNVQLELPLFFFISGFFANKIRKTIKHKIFSPHHPNAHYDDILLLGNGLQFH